MLQVINAYLGILSWENPNIYILPCFVAVLLDSGQFAACRFDKVSRTQAILIKFRVAKNINVAMDVT